MLREEIVEYLAEDWNELKETIDQSLKSDIKLLQVVNNDIIAHSGKMLRPIIAILIARMLNGSKSKPEAIKLAAATELLHNATLLHDDVADKSVTRRGRPTLSTKIGPVAAVLVGDFWLARAMQLNVSFVHRSELMKVFSKAMTALAEGEMLQLQNANKGGSSIEDYFKIIRCKTASLFEVACNGSAIICDASQAHKDAVSTYAISLGLAFQIKDDILDYIGDKKLGKPVGIDLKEQKVTLPLLCSFKNKAQQRQIKKMIKDIPQHPEYCQQIRNYVLENNGIEKAQAILDEHIQKALDALNVFPDCAEKNFLKQIALYNTIRCS